MRFMIMGRFPESSDPPPKRLMEAIAKVDNEATRDGVLVQTGGLLPSSMGTRIRLSGGRVTVTDGPFTEAKEVIGGYGIFEVTSKQEAIEWASRFMQLHQEHWGCEGEFEIRQMFDASDCGADA